MGSRNDDVKVVEEGSTWWRAGKEKRVGEGLVSSPIIVKKPARESSSLSMGFSLDRMPTSKRDSGRCWMMSSDQGREDQNAVMASVWAMLSKSTSMLLADRRLETRE